MAVGRRNVKSFMRRYTSRSRGNTFLRGTEVTGETRLVSNQLVYGPAGSRKRGMVKYRWPVRRRLTRLEMAYVKPEKHYKLIQHSSQAATFAAPGLVLLNGTVRGDTVQDRTGDRINLGKGHLSGVLHTAAVGASTAYDTRLMVILDSQSNGSALTTSILFGSATPDPFTMMNFNNYDFYKRFTVLHDEKLTLFDKFTIDAGSNFQPLQDSKAIEFGWDCKQFVADYAGGNAGTIADIRSGSIYLVLLVGNTNAVNLNFDSVQYFTDN